MSINPWSHMCWCQLLQQFSGWHYQWPSLSSMSLFQAVSVLGTLHISFLILHILFPLRHDYPHFTTEEIKAARNQTQSCPKDTILSPQDWFRNQSFFCGISSKNFTILDFTAAQFHLSIWFGLNLLASIKVVLLFCLFFFKVSFCDILVSYRVQFWQLWLL